MKRKKKRFRGSIGFLYVCKLTGRRDSKSENNAKRTRLFIFQFPLGNVAITRIHFLSLCLHSKKHKKRILLLIVLFYFVTVFKPRSVLLRLPLPCTRKSTKSMLNVCLDVSQYHHRSSRSNKKIKTPAFDLRKIIIESNDIIEKRTFSRRRPFIRTTKTNDICETPKRNNRASAIRAVSLLRKLQNSFSSQLI